MVWDGGKTTRRMAARAAAGLVLLAWLLGPICAAGAAERTVRVTGGAETVEQYARVEYVIEAPLVFDDPLDSGDVDVHAIVKLPSGKTETVPAFYYQPFEYKSLAHGRDKADWLYPVGQAQWRLRYAPRQVGVHKLQVVAIDRKRRQTSAPMRLVCTASKRRGFVRVAGEDPRYFAFDNGECFFPVGQNMAYVRTLSRTRAMLRGFAAAGGNYIRVWTCCEDWALGIASRKSAWGRSWMNDWPIGLKPDRDAYHTNRLCVHLSGAKGRSLPVRPSYRIACRPATKYVLRGRLRTADGAAVQVRLSGRDAKPWTHSGAKWTTFRHEITTGEGQHWFPAITLTLAEGGRAWLDSLSLTESAGGPDLLWEADVNRVPRRAINPTDGYLLDQVVAAAEEAGVYLQLCLLTRDHYMPAIRSADGRAYQAAVRDAKNLLRYAVARWGASTHVVTWEYFNETDPGRNWLPLYRACAGHLDAVDPHRHLRGTSSWAPNPKDWTSACLDVADEHYYMRPSSKELYHDAAAAVLSRARKLRQWAESRPALVSEFGVLNDKWRPTPDLARDKDYLHHHNALWASALSGLSGTVMHWLWDDMHKRSLYANYRGLSAFVKGVPFHTAKMHATQATVSDAGVRVVGRQNAQRAYVWLADRQAVWWHLGPDKPAPTPHRGVTVTLSGLASGPRDVQWWDTRTGKITHRGRVQSDGKTLRLNVPDVTGDIACKILPLP